jgi:TRAP-type C4-dicarboxylate transport system permease small subunit
VTIDPASTPRLAGRGVPTREFDLMSKLWTGLDRAIETLLFICFVAIVIVGTLQVFNRFVLNMALSWSEEFQRYGHIWLVYLAIPVAYRRGAHIGLDFLQQMLGPNARKAHAVVVELLWIALAAGILMATLRLMPFLQFQRSPGLDLRMDTVYAVLVLSPAYLIIVALRRITAVFFPT